VFAHLLDQQPSDEDLDLDQERARLAKEQADRTALENAERRNEVADLATIAEELGRVYASFRARVMAAPSKLAPLVNPENPNLARDIIAAEFERILTDLSAYQPGEGTGEYAADAGGDAAIAAATAAPNGKRVGKSVSAAQSRKQRGARAVQH